MRSLPIGFQLIGSSALLKVNPSALGWPLTGSMPR